MNQIEWRYPNTEFRSNYVIFTFPGADILLSVFM